MEKITQTEEEIRITISLHIAKTKKPDILLLPKYIKFNSPPIFFEKHLMKEIDETASTCRIYKNEAHLVLIKKEKEIWPEMFRQMSKKELMEERIKITDAMIEQNKKNDEAALERWENKRRDEISKEVKRTDVIRNQTKQFKSTCINETLQNFSHEICGNSDSKKEESKSKSDNDDAKIKNNKIIIKSDNNEKNITNNNNKQSDNIAPKKITYRAMPPARDAGSKIKVSFSSFRYTTPRRESQKDIQAFLQKKEEAIEAEKKAKKEELIAAQKERQWEAELDGQQVTPKQVKSEVKTKQKSETIAEEEEAEIEAESKAESEAEKAAKLGFLLDAMSEYQRDNQMKPENV